MYYILIYVLLSAIGIGCSFPIAMQYNIPFADIIYDYFVFLTFSGVVCGVILLLTRIITKYKFNPNSKVFKVSEKEIKFYDKIKLKKMETYCSRFWSIGRFQKEN